jgi:hypothetical protein
LNSEECGELGARRVAASGSMTVSVDGRVGDEVRGEGPGGADGENGIAGGPVDADAMLVTTPTPSLRGAEDAAAPEPAEPADDQVQATRCDQGADHRTVWIGSASQLKAELRARGISELEIAACSEKHDLIELWSVAESGISEVGAPEEAAVHSAPLAAGMCTDSAVAETQKQDHLVTRPLASLTRPAFMYYVQEQWDLPHVRSPRRTSNLACTSPLSCRRRQRKLRARP